MHFFRSLPATSRCGTLAAAAMALLAATVVAGAADQPPETKKWDTALTLGATLTRGNSRNFLGTGIINTKRKWTDDEALLGASAGYGETSTSIGPP